MRRIGTTAVLMGLLSALLLLGGAPAGADEIDDAVPEAWRAGVRRALSGGNGAALRESFSKLEGEERTGWAFLLAHTPSHHLAKFTEPLLTEHLKFAYRARAELPWAKDVPEDVFHHYVLPILSGDEKPEAYRKFFFEEVAPELKRRRVRTLEKAALEVNRWCGKHVTFKPSPPEDASPLETFERGYGRCEEEAIFYNAVARSVGIPARIASTPYWTFKASNHAWCEVWTGDRRGPWHYLGACEPSGKLDQGWFTGDAKRAALVLARTIGEPEGEEILASQGSGSVINCTATYAKTCEMTVEVRGPDGEAARADLTMYIWNEVGNEPILRSAFRSKTDDEGAFIFAVGPGDYVIHAKSPAGVGFAVARSVPGKKATCEIVLGDPGPAAAEHETRETGRTGLLLVGDETAAICPLDEFPWRPKRQVPAERAGAFVDLSPGRYLVQAGARKGDKAIELALLLVTVENGLTTVARLPVRYPKKAGRRGDPGAILLEF